MSKFTIYDKAGNVRHESITEYNSDGEQVRTDSLEYNGSWMGDCFVSLTVKSAYPIDFRIGDYVMYRGEKFVLNYDPTVIKKSRRGSYGEGFNYDNIKFHALQSELVDMRFLDYVLGDNQLHYTSLPVFPFYAASIDDFCDRLQANSNRYCEQNGFAAEDYWLFLTPSLQRTLDRAENSGVEGLKEVARVRWTSAYGEGTDTSSEKTDVNVSVSNQSIWDAMAMIKSSFGLNFINRGRSVIIGAAGLPTSRIFKYGKDKGLYEIERNADSEQQIITKLYAYGSEKNMPVRYYANIDVKYYATVRRIITSSPFKEVLVELPFDSSLYTTRNSSTGREEYHVMLDMESVNTKDCYVYQPDQTSSAFTDAEKALTIFNFDWSINVAVGDKIYIASGIKKDKWPYVNREYPEYLPNNMAVNRLMLPGFPKQSLYDWVLANGGTAVLDDNGNPIESHDAGLAVWTYKSVRYTAYFSKLPYQPFILSPNFEELGIRESTKTYDGSDESIEIYPTIEGTGRDIIASAEVITDNGVFEEGDDEPTVKITLPSFGEDFDLAALCAEGTQDGGTPTISMKSGYCGARQFTFDADSVKKLSSGLWEITCKREFDDLVQLYFPYSYSVSQGGIAKADEPYQLRGSDILGNDGDKYVLTGIPMSSSYVAASSVRLLGESLAYLVANDYTRYTYAPKVDELFMARQHEAYQKGEEQRSLYQTIKEGDILLFEDSDLLINGSVFIDTLQIRENGNASLPTYDITLRNDKEVGTLQRIQNQIDSLANGTGSGSGGGGFTSEQIRQLVYAYGAERFLSKTSDDTAEGNITFSKNISILGTLRSAIGYITSLFTDNVQSKNYSGDGIADTGYRLTRDDGTGSSKLTVDNLYVRKRATFEELEVKKETAVAGNEIRSSAANIVNRTDYYDGNNNLLGYSYTKVPWLLKRVPFLLRHTFFGRLRRTRIMLDADDVSKIAYIRCYFLAKDDKREVDNLWKADNENGHDLVRCQTMNLNNSKRQTYISSVSTSKTGNVFWWRKAVKVSTKNDIVTLDDNKEYHYVDVSMSDCADGSDIPAAGDHIVQFGNDSNPNRMNLIALEINGDDAPSIKAYSGIYTYDLDKCWWGGSPRKMMLSPRSGYEFYGPSFKYVQEYGQKPAAIERGAWADIAQEADDNTGNMVRKCYYYDKVSHLGCYWLCITTNTGAHWIAEETFSYGGTTYTKRRTIANDKYATFDNAHKEMCTRKQDYTTDEPSTTSLNWKKIVDRGTSVKNVVTSYAKQDPKDYDGTPPTSGWVSTIAELGTIAEGWFVWTRSVTTYSDTLSDTTTYSVVKWGIDGDGIENIETKFYEDSVLRNQQYLAGLSDSAWKEYNELPLTKGDYIYTRTKITYDKKTTPTVSYSVNRIGQDGVSYLTTEEYYCLGTSRTTPPTGHPYTRTDGKPQKIAASSLVITGEWSESRPTYDTSSAASRAKKYLWNFEVSYDTTTDVQVTQPICIANYEKGIVSIVETYAISAYAVAPHAGGYPSDISSWTDEAHDCAPTDEKPYQWNKTVTTYTDGTSDTFYHVSAVKGTRGRGISNTNIYYKAANQTPATPSGAPSGTDWTDDGNDLIIAGNATKHLYESTCTTYSNGTYSWTAPIDDGLISDMAATSEEFALADSATTAPQTGWALSVTPTAGKWIWSRTVLTFKNGTTAISNTQCVGYCGTNGTNGQNGTNGKDGWMITADPANVIITQALANNTSSFSSATVGFTAKKGSTAATIASIGTPSSSTFNVSASGNSVIVGRPKASGSSFYTEGSFSVNVNVTDPDTGSTVTFSVTVLCYANLLGSWKEKVEGDTKTEVARQLTYGYDPDSGQVIALSTFGEYIKSSEVNISRLESRSDSRNMLDCASGDGWRLWNDDSDAPYDNTTQKIGDGSETDAYSTAVFLKRGVEYSISLYASTQPSVGVYKCNGNPNAGVDDFKQPISVYPDQWQETYVVDGQTYRRHVGTFSVESDDYYKVDIFNIPYFFRPQLEVGAITDWVPGSKKNSSSQIRQTADEIEAKVNNTGVNITDGKIKARTGKFEIYNLSGKTKTFEVDNDGNLKATGGASFNGTLKAGSNTNYWEISQTTDGLNYPSIRYYSNGSPAMTIMVNSDHNDGAIFWDGTSAAYARTQWCIHDTFYEEDGTTIRSSSLVKCDADENNPRIFFTDSEYNNDATVGLNNHGMVITATNWPSKSHATNGMAYVDDWGGVKVAGSDTKGMVNIKTSGSFTLPDNAPDGMMFFMKNATANVQSGSNDYIEHCSSGDHLSSWASGANSTIIVKMGANRWVAFYCG